MLEQNRWRPDVVVRVGRVNFEFIVLQILKQLSWGSTPGIEWEWPEWLKRPPLISLYCVNCLRNLLVNVLPRIVCTSSLCCPTTYAIGKGCAGIVYDNLRKEEQKTIPRSSFVAQYMIVVEDWLNQWRQKVQDNGKKAAQGTYATKKLGKWPLFDYLTSNIFLLA